MKGSYRPRLQYLIETAEKTIGGVYNGTADLLNRTGDLLRRTYRSKLARRGLLTFIYLAGSANVLADNIGYSKLRPQQPTAPSGQTDSNSGKENKVKNPHNKEKDNCELGGIVDGIWHFPGNTGRGIGLYFEEAEGYGTVDDHFYRKLPPGEKRLDKIAEGVWFFPGHYVISGRNLIYCVGVGIPTEAMNRAKAEKRAEQAKQKPKKERNRKGLWVLWVPVDFVWDVTGYVLEKGVDTLRVGKHTAIVTIEEGGRLTKYSVKNPANTASMVGASYGIGAAINCIAGGDGDGGGAAGYTGPDLPDFTGK